MEKLTKEELIIILKIMINNSIFKATNTGLAEEFAKYISNENLIEIIKSYAVIYKEYEKGIKEEYEKTNNN